MMSPFRWIPGARGLVWSLLLIVALIPSSSASGATALLFPPDWEHEGAGSTARGHRFALSTTDTHASRVGREVLERGGNAVDAAVAIQFALAVTNPEAGNVGGGGFLVLRRANGDTHALDFREKAPLAATEKMYLNERGEVTDDSRVGHRAAGVPGTVHGMWRVHRRFGSLPWESVVRPAVELARGFEPTRELVKSIRENRSLLEQFEGSRRKFLPDGSLPRRGETFHQPDLARTLERVARRGPDGFYRGETARLIAGEMRRGGGLITREDLRQYRSVWREPIRFQYRNYRILSMPPPSSGGIALAQVAGMVESAPLDRLGWHTPRTVHRMVEAMRRAFADRNRSLGDPDFVEIPRERLLSDSYLDARRRSIRPYRATSSDRVRAGETTPLEGHTTHYSVVDGSGNAVSVTTTLNGLYGSGVTVRGAGIVLNNEMDDFTAKPGSPNMYGLVQGEANAIEPGKRMLSSMSPTIVLNPRDQLYLVTGSPGGPTIITTVFQVISNLVDFGMDPGRAVAAPRFHHQHLPDRVHYELEGFSDPLREALESLGHELEPLDRTYGDVQSVHRFTDGTLLAVSDPRQPGRALAR